MPELAISAEFTEISLLSGLTSESCKIYFRWSAFSFCSFFIIFLLFFDSLTYSELVKFFSNFKLKDKMKANEEEEKGAKSTAWEKFSSTIKQSVDPI
jgi:hypothetical protein